MKAKTTKSLAKKLKQYSALAATAVVADASGQVVYTDINDTTLVNNGDFFDIDLNNDGILEATINLYAFATSGSYGSFFYKSSYNGVGIDADTLRNEIATSVSTFATSTGTYSVGVAKAFSLNNAINNTANWASNYIYAGAYANYSFVTPYGSNYNTISVGQFPGAGDKYMGVRFKLNNNTHYGWVRMSISQKSDTVTIKDFAYNATANTPILAGDTGTIVGIREGLFGKNDLYAQANQIRVSGQLPANTLLRVRDLQGKVIYTKELNPNEELVSIPNVSNGIYIAELHHGKQFFRKKLWLEKE
jgi:hypothetical protein